MWFIMEHTCSVWHNAGPHVQLPKLWCPWCSSLMNSVLTGCVIWYVGLELQPGLHGDSSEGYSRVFIKKQ